MWAFSLVAASGGYSLVAVHGLFIAVTSLAVDKSMKLSHAYGATQMGRVMVERSDRMWSAGEGNGKPLQYS